MKSNLHKSNLRVGCSGFRYLKWCGSFYTKDATLEEMLRHYSANFDSVEIHDTYHGFLRSGTYEAWLDTVPKHFTFSIKVTSEPSEFSETVHEPGAGQVEWWLPALAGAGLTSVGFLAWQLATRKRRRSQ